MLTFELILVVFGLLAWSTASAQSSDQDIVEHFRRGEDFLKQEQFEQAIGEFKRVLRLRPGLVEAEINIGLAYHSLCDYQLAVDHLSRGLRQKPDLLAPNVLVGIDYLKLGSAEKAVPFLERALKLDPANQQARRALASSYLDQQNFRSAAEQFRQIAAQDPDQPEAWFKLGHDYLELAARLAYRGAHLYRDSAWGHRFLGDLLFQRDRWEEAIERYRNALRLDSKQPGLHTALAETYLQQGDVAHAESEFRLELELDGRYEAAWLGLAETALSRGDLKSALDAVGKVWEVSPEFLDLDRDFPTTEPAQSALKNLQNSLETAPPGPVKHFLERCLYALAGQTTQAEERAQALHADFRAWQNQGTLAARQDACHAHHYSACADHLQAQKQLTSSERLLLGKTFSVLRQYQAAAEAFERVSGVSTQNAEASYWLARAYQALGAESYARLEEQFPDSWRNHQLRAEGYALRQHPEEAVKELQLALALRPQEPELHEALGELYLSNHSDEPGLTELKTALKLDTARAHALCLLGRFYVHNGDNATAALYLQQAVRVQPDSIEASGLLGTVYVRLGQFASAIPQLEKAAAADHYGNVHYQLYQAYRKLGQPQLAHQALAQSQDLRRSSLEHDQAMIMGGARDEETQ